MSSGWRRRCRRTHITRYRTADRAAVLVVQVGHRHHGSVVQPSAAVHANAHLHAKVPLLALARLAHSQITLLVCVRGRAGCADDDGVQNGPGTYFQAALLQCRPYVANQGFAQLIYLQQATKLQQCDPIEHTLSPKVDAHRAPQLCAVQQCLFAGLISQAESGLDEVHSQHAYELDRWVPFIGLVVVRFAH